ncbi:MAG TPA: energy transducer TonB [Longimicrobium sp.]|nr:energy transducer TonB [Longimicrobium sp.]
MFEKVLRGRAERRPALQLHGISASVATHALCAIGITALSLGAATTREPVETATLLLIHSPVLLPEVPGPRADRPAPHPARGTASTAATAAATPAPVPEPALAAERALSEPKLTVDVPPPGGPALEAASLRGIGDLALAAGSDPSGGVTVPEGGGAPLVDSELLAVPPRVVNRREISELMSDRYPPILKFNGVEGQVVVAFIIGTDGRAEMNHVEVLSASNPQFIQAALEGLRRMRFRPAELDGVRVRVRVSLPLVWVMANG